MINKKHNWLLAFPFLLMGCQTTIYENDNKVWMVEDIQTSTNGVYAYVLKNDLDNRRVIIRTTQPREYLVGQRVHIDPGV